MTREHPDDKPKTSVPGNRDGLSPSRGWGRSAGLLLVVTTSLFVCALALPLANGQPGEPGPATPQTAATPKQQEKAFLERYCDGNSKTSVPSGTKAEAEIYYRDLENLIGFKVTSTTKLDDVIMFLGYGPRGSAPPITAQELQDAVPTDLMDPVRLGKRLGGTQPSVGDVLVARFFAPKVSDVSGPTVKLAGWRKLVLLRVQSGSPAASHIDYGIILFNFFAPMGTADPFTGNNSVNTQTILVGNDAQKSLYWLDFDKTASGALLSHSLSAFFDAGHIPSSATEASGATADYFVPCGCVACHGGLGLDLAQRPPAPDPRFRAPLLDYLDTDHWEDRVQAGDDFFGLGAPVLFDPGTLGVILLINQEIARQNAAAQPDSVIRRAADHWLSWHLANGAKVQPLFERSLENPQKPGVWNASDPVDAELLPKLNRFCFRCHGTVKFDVFDKGAVLAMKTPLVSSLHPRSKIGDQRKAMPPDRNLTPAEFDRLRDLLKRMK